MIIFLDGILEEKSLDNPAWVALNVGGVGYEVFVPLSTFGDLPRVGEHCRLLVYDCIREDAHVLYGFSTSSQRSLFLLLNGVSGVGPKIALSALSGMTVPALKAALVGGDVKSLSKISGIGKRTAERIVLELKGKIDPLEAVAAQEDSSPSAALSQAYRDALMALVQLGQSEEAAAKALHAIAERPDAPQDTAAIVRAALASK